MQGEVLGRLPNDPPASFVEGQGLAIGPAAARLLEGAQSHADFIARLVEAQLYRDALRYLAHGLPGREAVWWACRCLRALDPATLPPLQAAALAGAETWARQPSPGRAAAAFSAARAAGTGSPAGLVALAAFYGGDSIAPPGADPIAPPPGTVARLVFAALTLAALDPDPGRTAERQRAFLGQGVYIATGGQPAEVGARPAEGP